MRVFLLCFFSVLSLIGYGLDPIVLDRSRESRAMNQYIEIFEDTSNSLTIDLVSRDDFKGFVQNQEIYPYGINKNTESAYWVKFKVIVASEPLEKWLTLFHNNYL